MHKNALIYVPKCKFVKDDLIICYEKQFYDALFVWTNGVFDYLMSLALYFKVCSSLADFVC